MNFEVYQEQINFKLSHHTLVKTKDNYIYNEYILLEVEWLLENTSDNIFILIDDSNKNFWKKYFGDKSINQQVTFIKLENEFIEKSSDENFIRNFLFINRSFNKPSWFFISSFDCKYNDVIRRCLKGGRKYRLNLICLDNEKIIKLKYMFNHYINVTKL